MSDFSYSKRRLAPASYKNEKRTQKLFYARDETYVSASRSFPMNLSHVWLKNNDQNDNKRTAPSKQWYEERKPIPFLTADRNMRDNAICSDESIFPSSV